jgi:hypothetical protein
VDDSGVYPIYQLEAARSESVHLNPEEGYLFLFSAPSGANPIAKVMYATGTDVQSASGIVLPLNSQLQNMHIHFDNYRPCFVPVAEGTGLTIQQPNSAHPTEFHVISGSEVIFEYARRHNSAYGRSDRQGSARHGSFAGAEGLPRSFQEMARRLERMCAAWPVVLATIP